MAIKGTVKIYNGIPMEDISEKEASLLSKKYGSSFSRANKNPEGVFIENRILWTGKSMVMDVMFNDRNYAITHISAGDGAMEYFDGLQKEIYFQGHDYPTSYEVVPNEVFKKEVVDFGITTNLDGERSRACAVLIDPTTDIVGSFNIGNTLKMINSLSLVCSGPDLPFLNNDFDGNNPIPFSNVTIPGVSMDSLLNDIMYVNWVYRIV